MKIDFTTIYKLNIPCRHPIKTPVGTLDGARNVVIKLVTDAGTVGWGEASPFAPIAGDSQDSNVAMAKTLARWIKGKDPLAIETRVSSTAYRASRSKPSGC